MMQVGKINLSKLRSKLPEVRARFGAAIRFLGKWLPEIGRLAGQAVASAARILARPRAGRGGRTAPGGQNLNGRKLKWFHRLKIRTKLLVAFAMVAAMAALIGAVGINSLRTVDSNYRTLQEKNTIPFNNISRAAIQFEMIMANLRDILLVEEDRTRNLVNNSMLNNTMQQALANFAKDGLTSPDEREQFRGLVDAISQFNELNNQFIEYVTLDQQQEALALVNGPMKTQAQTVETIITNLYDLNLKKAAEVAEANTARTNQTEIFMIVVAVAGVLGAIGLGWYIAGLVARPVKLLTKAAEKLAVGDVEVEIAAAGNDEIGQLTEAFGKMVENTRLQARIAQRIAGGDLTMEIVPRSDRDILALSMRQMIDTLRKLIEEANSLTEAAITGRLEVRGDREKFTGAYYEIISGFNRTLDALIGPLNVAASYLDQIAKGEIPPRIVEEYQGDFNEIKNNLNQCIDAINALIADANRLAQAGIAGRLDIRADAASHQGDFRRIIEGVNETLDAVINPLNVAAEYVDRIAHGDIPPRIIEEYPGDFNAIRDNLNQCIEAIEALISDAYQLAQAAIEGDLSVRADTRKHQGDFRRIIEGVNETLDAVIDPLNMAAEYVDRIAKGDIPPRITGLYNGDFNEIKNNLNQCIDAINALIDDTDALVEAAIAGRLSTRADLERHQGDFRKIVAGINHTLDAVIEPVQEASAVLQEMAKGNLGVSMAGDYQGDHAAIKTALNFTIASIRGYIGEIAEVLDKMAGGSLNVGIRREYVGDFVVIKDSLNRIIDSFNEILMGLDRASEQVAASARHVSDSSQALSESAAEQASTVQEITASLGEIAAQTRQNALDASQANQLAISIKNNAVEGDQQMQAMLQAMTEIEQAAGSISKIIKMIDEIAFQTNILALNAAIEAARAGVYGKGFAVVAEEVRNLARRSAAAAKDTAGLIELSIKKVGAGTEIADKTAAALNRIVEGVTQAVSLMGEIAVASSQQATSIAQINSGVSQVAQVTQTSTATAEQSASASVELSGQAELLKDTVKRFTLKDIANLAN